MSATDVAQIVTAVAAVAGVIYAVRVGERTLKKHDEQLQQHAEQVREYVDTEGGAYCTNYRQHVLWLRRERGMSAQQIRWLLAGEVRMLPARDGGDDDFFQAGAGEGSSPKRPREP